MKHIEINIWKACNNKCRFCMSAEVGRDEKKLTDVDLVIKEINTYADKWYTSIGFLWWDISIHPHIFRIIKESKKYWFQNINVITNGMVFSDYNKAQALVLSWTTRVNISIHSHIHKIEDYITQIQGGLEKKLQAMDNFNDLYNKWFLLSPVSINIVVNGMNYTSVVESVLYFYKMKWIRDIRINFIWNRYFFTEQDKVILALTYTKFFVYLKRLVYIALKYNIRITFDSIPACILYKVDPKNYKTIIARFLWEDKDHIEEVSNINMDTTFDWKKQKTDDLKSKFSQCNNCIYRDTCQWVWKEYVEEYWESEFNFIEK